MSVRVLSNDGEIATLLEEDGTVIERIRTRTNEFCKTQGVSLISRDAWLKIWPPAQVKTLPHDEVVS
jgi:hypothetical protein